MGGCHGDHKVIDLIPELLLGLPGRECGIGIEGLGQGNGHARAGEASRPSPLRRR